MKRETAETGDGTQTAALCGMMHLDARVWLQGFNSQRTFSTRMVNGMPEATENWHTTMRP